MNVSLYARSLNLFCDALRHEAHVLELACGPGNITRYLLQKRPDLKILATDLAPNMLVIAKEHNPTAEFKLMDCRDLTQIKQKVDAIVCAFCFPYLTKREVQHLIGDAANLLNKGGMLYISTMEDSYEKSGIERSGSGHQIMIYYHELAHIQELLNEHGLTALDIDRKVYQHNGKHTTDLLIVAAKL